MYLQNYYSNLIRETFLILDRRAIYLYWTVYDWGIAFRVMIAGREIQLM